MYIDAQKLISENTENIKLVNQYLQNINELEKKLKKSFDDINNINTLILEILKLVGFNFGLLLPYYFPSCIANKPLSLKDRPFAFHFFAPLAGQTLTIVGSRQIGKSVALSARQRLMAFIIPGYSSVYIAPMSEQIRTYSTKFKEIENSFRYPILNYRFRQNLYLKEYPNKSRIEIINILTDSNKIRGKSANEIDFDEFQNFDLEFEPEVLELQTATNLKSTIYAGTSTTKDSALEAKWESSSKGRWVMKCPKCGHYNIPTPENNVMDMIQPEGICCSKCKAPLDVRNGFLEHENPFMLDMGYIGIHVPQIIVPYVVEDAERYNNLFMKKIKYPEDKFYQEVLGIATELGARELTLEHLMSICDSSISKNTFFKKAQNREYKYIISGCDWGGSDYDSRLKTKQSYTTHVIIGVKANGHINILHFRRFSGMDYEKILVDIINEINMYNVDFVGSDQGVGQFYNVMLRRSFPTNKHFIFQYVRQEAAEMAVNSNFPNLNMFLLNRDESISSLFYSIKKKDISTFNWKEAEDYIVECLNIVRVPDEKLETGKTMLRYRKHGSKPDDILHALNFAYAVARIITGESIFGNTIIEQVLATLNKNVDYDNPDLYGESCVVSG